MKVWTDGMKMMVKKWQDVAEEYRVTTFADPADGLHASHELIEEIPNLSY